MKANKLTKETVLDINVTNRGFPEFRVGDTIEIAHQVKEGDKERIQLFLGDVICIHNNGVCSTFTVRKTGANNIGVEKIFPIHSPIIDSIKLVKQGRVRRARLYYLRDKVGKSSRIKEMVLTKEEKQALANEETVTTPTE